MEARSTRSILSVATVVLFCLNSPAVAQFHSQQQFVAHSQNFIVFASSPKWASQVSQTAEKLRRDLAQHWLGQELPAWAQRCPIHVTTAPQLGAGGETRFSLLPQGAGNWMMSVQGTPERILDSVLPHEISHTIFATYFAPLGKYVPRWADEGACTTVEHESEKRKHRSHLTRFLQTGHGLAFNRMFSLKEYPDPILPLYAQGHSVVQFLIDQGGPQKFVQFVEAGMQTEAWEVALKERYAYRTLGEFQTMWNQWLLDGSPDDLTNYAPGNASGPPVMLASEQTGNSSAHGKIHLAIGNSQPAPVVLAGIQGTRSGQPQSPSQIGVGQQRRNGSWYKRRLQEVNRDRAAGRISSADVSQPATPGFSPNSAAQGARQIAAAPPANVPPNSASRPQAMQTPSMQVLDWGSSTPVPGMTASGSADPAATNIGLPTTNAANSAVIMQAGGRSPVQMVPVQR